MTDRAKATRYYTELAIGSLHALEAGDTTPRDGLAANHPGGAYMLLIGTEALLATALNVIGHLTGMTRAEAIDALAETTRRVLASPEAEAEAAFDEIADRYNDQEGTP